MRILLAVLALAATSPAMAQTPWPHPEDIPRPSPVSVPLAGSQPVDVTRYLLAAGPSSQSLSPDGHTLAYISNITGQPQIWVVATSGGAPRQLTYGLGVDGAGWTPDGSAIVYGADKGGDERYGYYSVSPDGTREREIVPQSEAFTYIGDFTADRRSIVYATTARDGRAFDLWTAALDGSGQREVMQGRPGLYPASTQPNGTLLLMQEARGEAANDVSIVDLATGVERSLFKPEDASSYGSFAWSPDGQSFYFVTDEGREFAAVARHDLTSGQTRIVAAPAHDAVRVVISPDGRVLVWATDEGGYHRLYARDLTTGRDLPAPALPRGNYDFEFARDASVLSILVRGPTTPGEIWTWSPHDGAAHQAVAPSLAGLDPSTLTLPEPVLFAARDGVPLGGLLYLPRGEGPFPVFLRLHGGPTSHARADWKPDMQYLVARGIAVLDFDYRGSTGKGKAGATLNDRRLRVNETGDLADAVAWIRTQPQLDGRRVAVGGASYGGYLTNAVLGEYPDLFIAGVSEVGVADWVRNLENAAPSLQASDRLEYGDVRDPSDRAFLASISPMNNAARIRAPLLVQVGANDPRNGAEEQDQFVQAIRDAGGVVTYRRYEGEGHQLTDLPNIIDWYRAKANFLTAAFARPID